MTSADSRSPNSQVHAIRGSVVTPSEIITDGVVIVADDRISWVGSAAGAEAAGFAAAVAAARQVPDGGYVLPGLIDLHCHGGGGASFPDATDPATAQRAAAEHLRHGTTSVVASLVTAAPETLRQRVATLAQLCADGQLAGIHLEGPFLSVDRCGAQNPDFMQAPNAALVSELAELAGGYLVSMTIAPELPGISGPGGVQAALVAAGAVPSIGHTDAAAEIVEAALAEATDLLGGAGARSKRPTATHLFNGMRPLHHRDPGPIAACLAAAARNECVVELVADGVHLAPATVRSVFDLVGPEAIVLVTDAMAAAGMPDGDYELGPVKVRVREGVARLADGDAIAGGTAHLIEVVRSTVDAGVPLVSAVQAASQTPAAVLGRAGEIGALTAGLRADLVITDAELRPVAVARRGQWLADSR